MEGKNLEDYLNEIKNCPDEKLADEVGCHDNCAIDLNANYKDVVNYFKKNNKFKLIIDTEKEWDGRGRERRHGFNYNPGTVFMQIVDSKFEDKLKFDIDESYYITQLRLHPYNERKIKDVHKHRVIANVIIEEIVPFIKKKKIPAKFVHSCGQKYIFKKGYEKRIVEYKPEK